MSTLVCVAILQRRVYDIAMVTAVYLHLNHKKSYLEQEITLLRRVLWANLVTLIGTCKHLECRMNIPAGVSLCSLYSQFSRHAPPESRNASTRLCFLTFSSGPAGHVKWSKREGDKSSFIFIDGTGFFFPHYLFISYESLQTNWQAKWNIPVSAVLVCVYPECCPNQCPDFAQSPRQRKCARIIHLYPMNVFFRSVLCKCSVSGTHGILCFTPARHILSGYRKTASKETSQ